MYFMNEAMTVRGTMGDMISTIVLTVASIAANIGGMPSVSLLVLNFPQFTERLHAVTFSSFTGRLLGDASTINVNSACGVAVRSVALVPRHI